MVTETAGKGNRHRKRQRDGSRFWVAIVAVVLILGFIVRIINFSKVYYLGTYATPNIDGMYHLRIIELFYHGFLHTPLFDSYLAFPGGAAVYWPLGFDLFLAVLGWPVFFLSGNIHNTAQFLAWCIPVLGAVSPLIIYFILLRLVRYRVTAVAGALFAALNWQLARVGLLATIDHHVAGNVIFALFTLLVIVQVQDENRKTDRALGLLLGLALWIYTAAITCALMLGGIYIIRAMIDDGESLLEHWRRTFKWGFITAAIVIIGYGSIRTRPFSTVYLSGFHLSIFAAGWLAPVVLSRLRRYGIGARTAIFSLIVPAIAVLAVFFIFHPAAAGIFLKRDPNAMVVRESQSLFEFYKLSQFLFMPTLLFTPFLLFFLVSRSRTEGHTGGNCWRAILVLFFVTAVMGISQIRFLHYTAVILLIVLPVAAEALGERMMGRWKRFGRPLFHVAIALVFAVQLAVCWGMAMGFEKLKHEPDTIRLAKVMGWIRRNTPETSGYFKPVIHPEYGILIPQWHYGHHLLFLAHRPEIGTPVGGTMPFIERINTCLISMAAETEAELAETCESVRARYLLVQSLGQSSLESYMAAAAAQHLAPFGHPLPRRWNQSFLYRLTDQAASIQPKLKYFHLVYEEPKLSGISDKNRWRLYQLLPDSDL